jgi:hypothetical protein
MINYITEGRSSLAILRRGRIMKISQRVWLSLFAGLIMLLGTVGCDSAPTPSPVVEPTVTAVAPLSDVAGATAFRLRNDWAGLSTASPITILYSVTKGADESFTGTGEFSIAGGTPKVVTSTESIAIPADVASAFLQKVAAFPIKEGTYTPAITHSDDNPLLTITVDTPGEGTLTVYSQSQGDQHIPWGASIAGRDYVIDSPAPAEAIALLDPYLKREVRQQLIDESGKK